MGKSTIAEHVKKKEAAPVAAPIPVTIEAAPVAAPSVATVPEPAVPKGTVLVKPVKVERPTALKEIEKSPYASYFMPKIAKDAKVDDSVPVNINGVHYKVPRGVPLLLRKDVLDVLHAYEDTDRHVRG